MGDASVADNHRLINESAVATAGWKTVQVALLGNPRFQTPTSFAIDLTGPASQADTFTFEFTSDYVSWVTLGSYLFSGTTITVTDTTVTSTTPERFYRAKKGGAIIPAEPGFIRESIPSGDSLVGNQLDSGDNRISALWPIPPEGMVIFKFDSGTQGWVANSYGLGAWDNPNMSLGPGEGALFRSPTATQVTFVGQVWQGFQIPLGY
jgi:hypothetical protein